ncbi:hypothetical protein GCM10010515_57740 [Streptomyces fructofermentans]|uniref:Uncharacterized protein n=1 Tax=Streptomyces fructofermentans TaxID=152141 RepID=A0A918U2C5_9ACTN|nr:hypothetical protein GCM10010515_57740 [Streptomyces fructofermentans]
MTDAYEPSLAETLRRIAEAADHVPGPVTDPLDGCGHLRGAGVSRDEATTVPADAGGPRTDRPATPARRARHTTGITCPLAHPVPQAPRAGGSRRRGPGGRDRVAVTARNDVPQGAW